MRLTSTKKWLLAFLVFVMVCLFLICNRLTQHDKTEVFDESVKTTTNYSPKTKFKNSAAFSLDGKDKRRYRKIPCVVNGGDWPNAVQCLRDDDSNEIYLPFKNFLRDFYEVDGFMTNKDNNDEGMFEFWTTSTKMAVPIFERYIPAGVFGSFSNYNVAQRERVKLISGIHGVPLSVQWKKNPYHYPVQIAQFALEHYSKNLTDGKRSELTMGNQWKDANGDHKLIFDTNVNATVTQFRTKASGKNSGIHLNFTKTDLQIWPIIRFNIIFNLLERDQTAGITVTLEKIDTRRFFYIHYLASDLLIKASRPNHISYGLGKTCCTKFRRITRNIFTDLSKGFLLLLGKKKKNSSKIFAKDFKLLSLTLSGAGSIFNLTQRTSSHDDHFFDAVDFLLDLQNQQTDGGLPVPVSRTLANGRLKLKSGWRSAMAQGHFMSAACRAFAMTGYQKYRNAALKATHVFDIDASSGGVRNLFLNTTIWFEEYPTYPAGTFVLNGFIYSLIGLYDSWKLCQDDQSSRRLFETGLRSLKILLPLYDIGSGSVYDLRHISLRGKVAPNLARWDYHAVHVYQLLWLYAIDKDELFKRTAERWIDYARGHRAKHN